MLHLLLRDFSALTSSKIFCLFRQLFVNVNNEKTHLTIDEYRLDAISPAAATQESLFDCLILVYAVNDENSFGELLFDFYIFL